MRILLLLFLSISSSIILAQPDRIILDEDFSDWQNIPIAHADPSGDSGNSSIDFGNLWISNDDAFVFFRLDVGDEINLQDNNEILIYLDTDNNISTGQLTEGIGADIIYNFGNRLGNFYLDNNIFSIGHNDIWLVSSPTVTSNQFEIAVSRDIIFFGQSLYQGNSIQVLFKNNVSTGDRIPDSNGGVTYNFDNNTPATLPEYHIDKSQDAQLRLLSYNVLRDDLFENNLQPSYNRIIKAINPDIIGFQEIYDHSAEQTADKVQSFIPLVNGEQWYHSKIQPDIIAVSKFPIIGSALIRVNVFSNEGNGAFLIDLDPATNTKLLFIVAHLPCCSNNSDRQLEIDAIMAFIREAKDGTGPLVISQNDPIVVIGDMNLVGFQQQQTSLITGDIVNESSYGPDFNPDWDGSPFADAKPIATNLPLAITWYSEGSDFSPGRLDYMLYTGSVLDLKNSFSLFTPGLSPLELAEHGLALNDVIVASDHLPVVADFDLAIALPTKDIVDNPLIDLQVFPNPFQENAHLIISLSQKSEVQIQLFDIAGKPVALLYQGTLTKGEHQLDIKSKNLANGIYVCRMKTKVGLVTKKMIISK